MTNAVSHTSEPICEKVECNDIDFHSNTEEEEPFPVYEEPPKKKKKGCGHEFKHEIQFFLF